MFLSRDAILKVDDLPFEDVEVKEWGGVVRIRTMTGSERDAWEQALFDEKGKIKKAKDIRASFLVLCLIDENGQRIFKDTERDTLGAKSSLVLDRLFTVAQRLNGLGKKDVEELEKNLGGDQSADFTSG
jgi:hypothetical protein